MGYELALSFVKVRVICGLGDGRRYGNLNRGSISIGGPYILSLQNVFII